MRKSQNIVWGRYIESKNIVWGLEVLLGSQTCNSTVGESSWLGLIQSNLITTTTGYNLPFKKPLPWISHYRLFSIHNTNKFWGPNPKEPKGFLWSKSRHNYMKT